MNVFFIPSWYPSATSPLPGVFFREQALALGKNYEDLNVGISTWGQNDERLLLWAREPLQSLRKMLYLKKPQPYINKLIADRVIEYISPEYTWTSRFRKGNLKAIVRVNFQNLKLFQQQFGKTDIIHAHVGYPGGYLAKIISEKTGLPYVITEQMSPFPHGGFLTSNYQLIPELQSAYKHSMQNIAISNALAKKMKSFGVENTVVIPNLVDEDFFRPPRNEELHHQCIFFTLGRMVPQKGIDILLKAFAQTGANACLRMGGSGPSLLEYQALAKKLGIENKVLWLGELSKNEALLEFQNCHAFVLPSRHESMGVVFAEAMACGKPVIATVSGGPEEFVTKDVGMLVSAGSVSELSNALAFMAKSFHQYDSQHIRDVFEERFSSRRIVSKIRRVYEKAVSHNSEKSNIFSSSRH